MYTQAVKTASGECYVTSTSHVSCAIVCWFSEGQCEGQYQSESQCAGQNECSQDQYAVIIIIITMCIAATNGVSFQGEHMTQLMVGRSHELPGGVQHQAPLQQAVQVFPGFPSVLVPKPWGTSPLERSCCPFFQKGGSCARRRPSSGMDAVQACTFLYLLT